MPPPVATARAAAVLPLAVEPNSPLALETELRAREYDPAFLDAPVLDVYGRISKNPDTGELEKVDRQLVDCLRDLGRRHARLGMVLRDDGVSAWRLTAKRTGWTTLVARLEDGRAAGVICWHTDRLMRQPRDLERLIDLGGRGVLVGSCNGDYNLNDADDRFTLRILTAAAAKDSDNTSRRQKRKAKAMRDSGRRSGGQRAFGEPGKLRTGEIASAEQVAAERDALRWAVSAHLSGTSLHAIGREWAARGLTTTVGNPWDARTLSVALRAPRLAGLHEHHGVVIGRLTGVEPIITREEHDAITALFASRRRGRPVTEPYLLSGGFLFCEHCEQPMTGRTVDTRGARGSALSVRSYMCRKRDLGCGRMAITVARCDAAVRDYVITTLSDPAHARQVARQSAALAAVQAKLDQAEGTATELSRRLGEGALSLDRFDAATAPLDARISRLREEVQALRGSGAGTAARQASADEIALAWDDEETTVDERRVLVRSAAPNGFYVHAGRPSGSNIRPAAERLSKRTARRTGTATAAMVAQ